MIYLFDNGLAIIGWPEAGPLHRLVGQPSLLTVEKMDPNTDGLGATQPIRCNSYPQFRY